MKSIVGKKRLTTKEKLDLLTNKFNIGFTALMDVIHKESGSHNEDTDLSASGMYSTVRQIIFGYRYPEDEYIKDVTDNGLLAMSQGNARHTYAELAWQDKNTVRTALRLDGLDPNLYNAMLFNPVGEIPKGKIPVYIEQELPLRKVNGLIIGGTPDLIFNGGVEDYKTSSPYTKRYKGTMDKYLVQLSSYKWQAPDIITKDVGKLLFRYPRWNIADVHKSADYPKTPLEVVPMKLFSVAQMEEYIQKKTKAIIENLDKPDNALPPCPEGLLDIKKVYRTWSSIDRYKKGKQCGRVFYERDLALAHAITMKSGALVEFSSAPSLCNFCAFKARCNQYLLINKESEKLLRVW